MLFRSEIQSLAGPFDEGALVYPWKHPDARVDRLCDELQAMVHAGAKLSRWQNFERIENAAQRAAGMSGVARATASSQGILAARATIPYLNEPWYC